MVLSLDSILILIGIVIYHNWARLTQLARQLRFIGELETIALELTKLRAHLQQHGTAPQVPRQARPRSPQVNYPPPGVVKPIPRYRRTPSQSRSDASSGRAYAYADA